MALPSNPRSDPWVRAALTSLVAALFFISVGHFASVPLLVRHSLQVESRSSWWLAFLPIWIGDGLAVLFELTSIISALPLLRRVLYGKELRKRSDMESLLPVVKSIGTWNCCLPLVGALPPLPVLLLMLWFEVWLCAWLSGGLRTTLFVVFAPLWALELLSLCHFCFIATHSNFRGLCGVGVTVFSVLLPVKLEYAREWPWALPLAPLFAVEAAAFLSCLYILGHHAADGGRLVLERLQLVAVVLFGVSSAALLAATALFLRFLNSSPPLPGYGADAGELPNHRTAKDGTLLWSAAACLMVSAALFGLPLVAIARWHLDQSLAQGLEVPKRLGAGWDVDSGMEEWLCLGHVALKPSSGEHWTELAGSCASCTSRDGYPVERDTAGEEAESEVEPLMRRRIDAGGVVLDREDEEFLIRKHL